MATEDINTLMEKINAISALVNEGKCNKALRILRNLDINHSKSLTMKFNKSSLLIDIGLGLGESKIIEEGIEIGVKLLKENSCKDYNYHLWYNTANGYMNLYELECDKGKGFQEAVGNINLQKAKENYRKAIKETDQFDFELRKQLWTNYGNCLDTLGRGVEAFYSYEEALKINPTFSMALGNKAKAMLIFANVSGAYREAIYIKSHQILQSVLEDENLVRYGAISAKRNIEDTIKRIEKKFEDKSKLSEKLKHPPYDLQHATDFEKFYIEFCSKYNLFLNLHVHDHRCEASIVDPVFIRMITPIDDRETFYNLAKHINQIKEDYAIARLLLVQSQFKTEEFNHISERTTFVNTLDYSMFNIYAGLLKSAFKEAYNILDKISRFINEYYGLGIDGNIYFTTIWQEKTEDGQKKIRQKNFNSNNVSLYALYDIFLDFDSGHYQQIKDIRNASVHERLVIYESSLTDWDEKRDKNNIGYETMESQTIYLLQLVRSSIIYMINFVEYEENKKRSDALIAPMYVDTTQAL